jgi:ParB/RepB/Spo0J family partition protein
MARPARSRLSGTGGAAPPGAGLRAAPRVEADQTALLVPLERIVPGANARSQDADDDPQFGHFLQSVQEQGILEPLLVRELHDRPLGTGRAFELIAGFRRYAAARTLQLPRVPVRVIAAGDDEAVALNLAENLARSDLSEGDALRAVASLQETYGWGVRQISRATGRAPGWISELLAVSRSQQERDAVEAGRLGLDAAARLARLRSADPDRRRQLLDRLAAGERLHKEDVPRVQQVRPRPPAGREETGAPSPEPPLADPAPPDPLSPPAPAGASAPSPSAASAPSAPPATPESQGDQGPPDALERSSSPSGPAVSPGPPHPSVPLDLGVPEEALVRNLRLTVRHVLTTLHASWDRQGRERTLPAHVRADLQRVCEDVSDFLQHAPGSRPPS